MPVIHSHDISLSSPAIPEKIGPNGVVLAPAVPAGPPNSVKLLGIKTTEGSGEFGDGVQLEEGKYVTITVQNGKLIVHSE